MKILILTKRQYMNKDLLDDLYGRFREIPLQLGKKGHQIFGLCLSYKMKNTGIVFDGPVKWESVNAGIFKVFGILSFVMKASKYVKSSDVVWACSDSIYGIIGCALCRVYKKPIIFDLYEFFDEFILTRLPVIKQLFHWAIRHSDAITVMSRSYAEFLDKRHGRKKEVYLIEFSSPEGLFKPRNKLASRKKLNLPLDGLLLGTAGAICKSRAINLFLDAFPHLKKKYPNFHIVLAGPIDDTIKLPKINGIKYMGVIPHHLVTFFYNSMDIVFIGANRKQGRYCLPAKTSEMIACDVPIIAMNIGDMRYIFKDHPEWLFEDGNVNSLLKAIENRIADSTTNYVQPPSWAELANRLEKIIISKVH